MLAVREDHSGGGEPANTIVALDLDGPNLDGGAVLCAGADFYSTPELSASGRLAWTQWNHPNMPWDSTTIMVGSLSGTTVVGSQSVAGGPSESAVHPRWLGDEADLRLRSYELVEPLPVEREGGTAALQLRRSSASRSGYWASGRTRSSTMIICCAASTAAASGASLYWESPTANFIP